MFFVMQQGKGKRKGVKRERKEEVDGVMQLTSGLPREGHSSVRGITWSSYGFHDLLSTSCCEWSVCMCGRRERKGELLRDLKGQSRPFQSKPRVGKVPPSEVIRPIASCRFALLFTDTYVSSLRCQSISVTRIWNWWQHVVLIRLHIRR